MSNCGLVMAEFFFYGNDCNSMCSTLKALVTILHMLLHSIIQLTDLACLVRGQVNGQAAVGLKFEQPSTAEATCGSKTLSNSVTLFVVG